VYTEYTVFTTYTVSMEETPRMGIRELRQDLGRRVDAAHFLKEATVITKNDEPRAALVPYEWYERMLAAETMPTAGQGGPVPRPKAAPLGRVRNYPRAVPGSE
jgi:antitoxin (DNA-binding transcriptional repressor) of toxin-antitoxin stability system